MTIPREQVADLHPGDVVEIVQRERITIAQVVDGEAFPYIGDGSDPDLLSLTVISRAPRPLYVNHDRTEPQSGDVVTTLMNYLENWRPTWCFTADGAWIGTLTGRPIRGEMPTPLRLLIDGETGQVVQ